jgi:AcrR family transcriptional regulator
MIPGAGLSDELTSVRRPDRGVARRQAFLLAARAVFLEQGYEAASVNDVVRMAGGSLATLYAQFGNKEGLFLAVAQEQHERFVRAMAPDCVDHLPLEKGLQVIGESYMRTLLLHDNLAFFRVLIGEGRKFPHLLQRYFAAAAERVSAVVADYLKRAGPEIANPEVAASYFLDLLRGRHLFQALADDAYELKDPDCAAHVARVVRFFMSGAGVRAP